MVLRVQHVDGEYRVVLSPEAVEALRVQEGSAVEVVPVVNSEHAQDDFRYATVEEGSAAYERTERLHRNTYRELAK